MAREQQIDLSQVQGSGPAGRVLSSDLPSGVAVQSVAAHSTALHAQWLTQGEGVPLVLLHGFGADHGSWKPFAAMLEGKASLAIDLPNHGKSPLQTTDSLAGLAQAVWSTLQAQGVTQCHLLGHSLGGAVALSLVELAPGLVKSVSLIAPAGLGPDINGAFIDGLCRAESEASLRPWMEELVSDRKLISGSFIATAHKQLAAPAKRTALRAMAARLMPDGTQSESVRHVLQDLRVPTKVIWGTEDRIIPAHHGHHLPGQIGLHVLRGVGHLPYVESPQLVAQLVVQQMRH
jgi:pyruvate dehydrogenase E2 component (dihydrolipoamide acetyltransferase)